MTSHAPSHEGYETIARAARTADMLDADEERREARRALAGDARAVDRLVRAHLRLVLAMAWEFRSYGMAAEDLVAEGLLGLVKAVRGFDPDRGVRLASYAAYWIRAYMRRCSIENRRIVRPPASRAGRKVLAGLRRTERRLEQDAGVRPDVETLAQALGVGVADVEEMRAALGAKDVPLDAEVDGRRHDVACNAPSPESLVIEREQRHAHEQLVQQALEQMPSRTRRIVEQRCLRDGATSLSELSDEFGISRERVRQIEADAKSRMRALLSRSAGAPALDLAVS